MKFIRDIFVNVFKSKKLKLPKLYKDEVVVLVSVSIDNLNDCSNDKKSSAKILDSTNIEIINNTKTKKAIFVSSSPIFVSELYKFLSVIFIGFTNSVIKKI